MTALRRPCRSDLDSITSREIRSTRFFTVSSPKSWKRSSSTRRRGTVRAEVYRGRIPFIFAMRSYGPWLYPPEVWLVRPRASVAIFLPPPRLVPQLWGKTHGRDRRASGR